MEPENLDAPEVLETPEMGEDVVETPDERDARIMQLEQEKLELEKKNKHLFERAKKQPAVQTDGQLSLKDSIFIAKADIHEDDLDEVLEWSKFKKVSVQDAYKQLKPTLNVRNAERVTAAATQVGGGARGATQISGEDLLARAVRTGEVPDTNEGMRELFKARRAESLGKLQN